MKKIHLLPPPSEKQIYIVQTKMAIHDIVSLAYYLENFDRSDDSSSELALIVWHQIKDRPGRPRDSGLRPQRWDSVCAGEEGN